MAARVSPHVHGRCGACGGLVVSPSAWLGTTPPVPRCESCGRVPAASVIPVIEMAREPYEKPGEAQERLRRMFRPGLDVLPDVIGPELGPSWLVDERWAPRC